MARYNPKFVRLTLNKEEWERKIEVDENSVRLRRIKGYKPPRFFEWQWDGETYSLAPGEDIVVDEVAAKAGMKASMVFPRDRDAEGNELMQYDHGANMYPMLEIVEEFNAADPTIPREVPEQKQQRCPFCRNDVDDLEVHLPVCNLAGLAGKQETEESSLSGVKSEIEKKLGALQNA